MKTAEQRVDDLALDYGWTASERRAVLRAMQEHARDQRQICADCAVFIVADSVAAETHESVLNARAPGEG